MMLGARGNIAQHAENRRRQRVITLGKLRVATISREQELYKIIRADRYEIGFGQKLIELPQLGGHFDHGADLDRGRWRIAACGIIGLGLH